VALNVKTPNHIAALKKTDVPPYLIDWLILSKTDVKLTASQFEFKLGSFTQHVPVTLDILQKLHAGTLPVGTMAGLSMALMEAIKTIKNAVGDTWADKEPPLLDTGEKKGALNMLPPIKVELTKVDLGELELKTLAVEDEVNTKMKGLGVALQSIAGGTKQQGLVWPTFDLKLMKSAPLTKLRDATHMYQPVHGTSGGSRYYVVAANKDVRVAARYEGMTLSVRIEGPQFENHVKEMSNVGLEVKHGKAYASVHLAVGNDMMTANKTLGALLMGLGLPLETPFPNLKIIKG